MNAIEERVAGRAFAKSEIDDIMEACYRSTELFAKTFFPERFTNTFSDSHLAFFDLIDNSDAQYINIIAHRGWGKSTIGNLVLPAKELVYRDRNFLLQLANTAAQAERDSEDLKQELLTNELLLSVWGSVKPDARDTAFSKEAWKTPLLRNADGSLSHRGTLVMPRGWGQQVRGLKNGRFRPDMIVADDIEGTEGVMSDDQRLKLRDWVDTDLLNTVQRSDKLSPGEFRFRVIFIGSLLHQDSLLANFAEQKAQWTTITAPLCIVKNDGSVISLWTDYKSNETARELYEDYRDVKKNLGGFAREYLCTPGEDKAGFDKDWFKYFTEDMVVGNPTLESVVIVDPSKTAEERHADTGIVGWSLDCIKGNLYVRDIVSGQILNDDMYREAAEMAKRIGAGVIGVESSGLAAYVMQPFKDFLRMWGYNLELVELRSPSLKGAKDDRIKSLLPYYRQGRVYHNRSCCAGLELQLLAGTKAKRKDIADAAAYVVQMLDLGNRTFSAPILTDAQGKTVDQFAELAGSYQEPFQIREPAGLSIFDRPKVRQVSRRLHNTGDMASLYSEFFKGRN